MDVLEKALQKIRHLEREVERLSAIEAGGTWLAYTPTWTAATTDPVIGNGTLAGRYCRVGKLVTVTVKMIAGATTTFGVGIWSFALPVASANNGGAYYGNYLIYDGDTGNFYDGSCGIGANASIISSFHRDSTTTYQFSASAPITWATSDEFYFTVTYEAA